MRLLAQLSAPAQMRGGRAREISAWGTFAAQIQQGLKIPVMQGRDLARYCISGSSAGGSAIVECPLPQTVLP
jgi:hypothetical protein